MDNHDPNSILGTVKKMLGLETEYTVFDTDVTVLINSALMTLHQLGVGPKNGMIITGYDETWNMLLVNSVKLEAARMYVYLKVKNTFDPPTSSFVLEAYNKQIAELEWRLNVQAESVEKFDFVEKDKTGSETEETAAAAANTIVSGIHIEFDGEIASIIPGGSAADNDEDTIYVPAVPDSEWNEDDGNPDTTVVPLAVSTTHTESADPKNRLFADTPVGRVHYPAYTLEDEGLQLNTELIRDANPIG